MRNLSLGTRIRLARLEHAVTRLESAAVIAMTIIAAPSAYLLGGTAMISHDVWIGILLFGLAAEGVLIWASLSEPASNAIGVGEMLGADLGVRSLQDDAIRGQLTRAIEYRAGIEVGLSGKGRALRAAMAETVAGVDSWLSGIVRLAKRLDRFRDAATLQSADKFELRERIHDLEKRAGEAADKRVQGQLRETMAGRRHQLRLIEELESQMERGELQLEHAVGALGTIYAQITIFAARGMDHGDAAGLAHEISDEIGEVDAMLVAMDRVYEPDLASSTPATTQG